MTHKHILLITVLNEPELIFLYTVKCFQVFLYQLRIVLFSINHLFAHSLLVPSIAMYP